MMLLRGNYRALVSAILISCSAFAEPLRWPTWDELISQVESIRALKAPRLGKDFFIVTVTDIKKAAAKGEIDVHKNHSDRRHDLLKMLKASGRELDPTYEKPIPKRSESFAAFYDYGSKTVFLPEFGRDAPKDLEDYLIIVGNVVHEIAHAFLDHHVGLVQFLKQAKNNDARLALSSVVEGDAEYVRREFIRRELIHRNMYLSDCCAGERNRLEKYYTVGLPLPAAYATRPYLWAETTFPYKMGSLFLFDLAAFKEDYRGPEAGNYAFAHPPTSTSEIMNVAHYLSGHKPMYFETKLLKTAAIEHQVKSIESNVMGAFRLSQIFSDSTSSALINIAMAGWRGDRYWMIEAGNSRDDFLVMRTSWSSDDEYAEAFEFLLSQLKNKWTDRSVSFVRSGHTVDWFIARKDGIYAGKDPGFLREIF